MGQSGILRVLACCHAVRVESVGDESRCRQKSERCEERGLEGSRISASLLVRRFVLFVRLALGSECCISGSQLN